MHFLLWKIRHCDIYRNHLDLLLSNAQYLSRNICTGKLMFYDKMCVADVLQLWFHFELPLFIFSTIPTGLTFFFFDQHDFLRRSH